MKKRNSRPGSRAMNVLLLFLLAAPLLSGCWDRLEIDDRAVILGVSVDIVEDEEAAMRAESEVSHVQGTVPPPRKGMVRVGAQIALPGRIPLGPGEGGGGGGNNENDTIWVLDVVGHSINDALMNLQQQVSSQLFYGHLRIIVVSEKIAERGLENINDYFRRNSAVRRNAWLMVSKGKALDLLNASPKLERIPTLYLMSTLDNGIRLGKFPKDYMGQFWSNSSKIGQEGFLPYVELLESDNVEIRGLAYFKGDRMVGTTKALEIAGYLGLKGNNPAGYRAYVLLNGPAGGTAVMTNVKYRRSDWKLQIKDGIPHFNIHVVLEANLEEKLNRDIAINDPEVIRDIGRKQEELSVRFYENIIGTTQRKQSDFFGFGEYVRAHKPRYWREHIKTKEDWQSLYQRAGFEVHVNVNIRRIGTKAL